MQPRPDEPAKRTRKFVFYRTDSKCTDAKASTLSDGYLLKTLRPGAAVRFEKHLPGCLACSTRVANARMLVTASQRHDTEIGPSLAKHFVVSVLATRSAGGAKPHRRVR